MGYDEQGRSWDVVDRASDEAQQPNATLANGVPTKPSNPKDAIGTDKLPVDLVPDTIVAGMALAFLEGALKYGKYNWRVAGVRFSIYWAAFERHRMKLMAGEWSDPKTLVPHLYSMAACCAIIADARLLGKLDDDRPPPNPGLIAMIDSADEHVKYLKGLFKNHHPKQWTISNYLDYEQPGKSTTEIVPSEIESRPDSLPNCS